MITQDIKKKGKIYRILGPKGGVLISTLAQSKRTVFTVKEASVILQTEPNKVWRLLLDLVKKGWLKRLEKGKYLLIPLEVDSTRPYTEHHLLIASKLIPPPYYIAYWTMLNHYGYTEQVVPTVFIASVKRKRETTIAGVTYKFIKLSPYKFFGIANIEINGNKIQVSDKEKTIIDCLDHPEYCGGIVEVAKGIWNAREDINYNKLLRYAQRMRNSSIMKRLGFILEIFGVDKKIDMEILRKNLKSGFSPLDPLLPHKGSYLSRWNLLINISKEELLSIKRV